MQHIRPPAAASRTRGRHRGIALSFLLAVVLPFAVATWYLYERAADQYASYLGFSVRTEESSSAIELWAELPNFPAPVLLTRTSCLTT
ncbi:hypothetical protein [Parasedimentitalea marina]|uniref:hypothetical protein n=1 Tax=Parasedimentitalea marina TaxID=2483033 RepID=UPI001EE7CFAB|nr:hypothetical protein [Parasedimentitalea marina]